MSGLPKKLVKKLEKRALADALRELSTHDSLVDFFSNDYLGFSQESKIVNKAQEILSLGNYKNSATGSRLLSGNHELYNSLENNLVDFHKCEAALIFNSGYDANLGFFGAVPQRGDFVFYDELVHASIRDGIKLGNAKAYKFKHNDLDDLKTKIKLSVQPQTRRLDTDVYIVTESVFSMDGDTPDLKMLSKFCKENGYHLVVDEAHAFGVFGMGLCQELEIQETIFARIITFGKALGCHGAAILGSLQLKEYLVNFARSFIYTTALPPHAIATISAAYMVLISNSGKANQKLLLENITYFKQELRANNLQYSFIESKSAIQCMTKKGNTAVKALSEKLKKEGFTVKAILSPTVPKGAERLRFCLHSFNTKEEIKKIVHILKTNR